MPRSNRTVLTRRDVERLRAILNLHGAAARDRDHLLDLREELDRARVVAEHEIPADVVTLESVVRVLDRETGVSSEYTVVMPAQADAALGYVSVVAPLGTALLGYRENDEIEWRMPGGVRKFRIVGVRQLGGVSAPGSVSSSSPESSHIAA